MPLYTDQLGRTFELHQPPKRIVSLVPSQTELLFDFGLEEEVVGITKFCVHPEEWFRTKTRVGGTKQLQLDKIKELQPDLIIANKEENVKEQRQLEEHKGGNLSFFSKALAKKVSGLSLKAPRIHTKFKVYAVVDQMPILAERVEPISIERPPGFVDLLEDKKAA